MYLKFGQLIGLLYIVYKISKSWDNWESCYLLGESEWESHSVMSDSETLWTIQCMEFSRPDTGVGSLSLLQGIFLTPGPNPGLLHCRQIYRLSHQGSPGILKSVAYPFSSGSSDPGIEPGSPALQVDSLLAANLGSPFAWCIYTKNIDMWLWGIYILVFSQMVGSDGISKLWSWSPFLPFSWSGILLSLGRVECHGTERKFSLRECWSWLWPCYCGLALSSLDFESLFRMSSLPESNKHRKVGISIFESLLALD